MALAEHIIKNAIAASVTVLFWGSTSLMAQNEIQTSRSSQPLMRVGLKVNMNYALNLDASPASYSIANFTPAVVVATKRNTCHEAEVSQLMLGKKQTAYYQTSAIYHYLNVGLRYQHTFNLTKKISGLVPQVGLSALCSLIDEKVVPTNVLEYARRTSYVGGLFGVAPQVRYLTGGNFFFDASILFNFIDLGYQSQQIENPSIPVRQQKNGGVKSDFNFPGQMQFRIALGIRLD